MNEGYWEEFYREHKQLGPSSFAEFVGEFIGGTSSVLEFGCGDGRDAIWFHQALGWRVGASDRVSEGWQNVRADWSASKTERLQLFTLDLAEFDKVRETVTRFFGAIKDGPTCLIYSRFVLHSITSREEENLLNAAARFGPPGHKVCFEYRSLEDEVIPKVFGAHARRYVDHAGLINKLERFGYEIEFEVSGRGLAEFMDEDPSVGRVIARKLPSPEKRMTALE